MENKDMIVLYQKLHSIMEAIPNIPKDKRNIKQNYDYASEEIIKRTIQPLLIEKKVLFSLSAESMQCDKKVNKSGNEELITHMLCNYKFIDIETGAVFEGSMYGSGYDATDKGTYKAITGAIKYILTSTFLIPTGDDSEDDGNEEKTKKKTSSKKSDKTDNAPICDKCGKPMKIRSGKKGDFWGCTGYPDCRNTKQIGEVQPQKAQKKESDDGELDEEDNKQIIKIKKLLGYVGWTDENYRNYLEVTYGKRTSKDLTKDERKSLIKDLSSEANSLADKKGEKNNNELPF